MSEAAESTVSNAPEWSVSELSASLKRTVEDAFGFVRVRGEISGFKGASASGHVYFALKDDRAKIDAVIWKGVYGAMKLRPQEGLEVIATGKLTTFPGKSSYQIVIDRIELAGLGALMAMLEERRRKLAAEGLFDEARKQLLPYLPEVIGVVTSPTGAVIRDILHRLADRFPRHVIVWPVRVQGETSAAEVAAAIEGFNALPECGPIPRPDVIIVARGGGSLEDLMGFNDEAVVRAAAASHIPLVAAVGHETDWTLIDYAADLRCPTPTGAAEKVVPVRAELIGYLDDLARRQRAAIRRLAESRRAEWRSAARALPAPDSLLAPVRQRLDLAVARLGPALERNARVHRVELERVARRLAPHAPQHRLALLRQRLAHAGQRLQAALAGSLAVERGRLASRRERLAELTARAARAQAAGLLRRRRELDSTWKLAASLGPQAVLSRGYALVTDAEGRIVRSASSLVVHDVVTIAFGDGHATATVNSGPGGIDEPASSSRPPAPSRKPEAGPPVRRGPVTSKDQGNLF